MISPAALTREWRCKAWAAYSEQLGWNRQAGKNMGEIQRWYPRTNL